MLNKIIKGSFVIIGGITGFTLLYTFTSVWNVHLSFSLELFLFIFASLVFSALFFVIGNKTIEVVFVGFDKLELFVQKLTLFELTVSSVGLVIGLIIANLVSIPILKLDVIGLPLSIFANIFFSSIFFGIGLAVSRRNEGAFDSFKDRKESSKDKSAISKKKLLDTSIIIDGRIVDICKAGFLEGELVVPGFVLEELRHIADSADQLKRNRGRRGLDILNILQKELNYPVKIEEIEVAENGEVDDKLLRAAKKLNCAIMTIDYNLSKVASFQGVNVLNINELANALKPIALPGEEMIIQVIKDGKENGQGIGYLDDGTMIVVEGGRRHIGESINVMVTSVLQTTAGRMIFAKPNCQIERVI